MLPQSQADLATDLDDDDCLLAADALRCGQQSQLPSGGLVDRLGKVFAILWDGSRAWRTDSSSPREFWGRDRRVYGFSIISPRAPQTS